MITKISGATARLFATTLIATAAMTGSAVAEDKSVAFLSASSANTWLGASRVEMERVAAENGIKVVEFDGQFDGARQATQMQDVISSGQYDGIILTSMNGAGAIPDIEAAQAEGLKVVILNQIVGTDLTTSELQVEGLSGSVLAAPFRTGERMGTLTAQACEGIDPCEVVYFYGIKGIPLDVALKDGFDSVLADHPNISVVAEGEGKYLGPDQGLSQTQDILQVQPEFDVIVGSDQAMQGAQIALEDEGMLDDVSIIGFGGSAAAIEGIKSGAWFGGVMGAPGTEGRLAMEAMVDALATGASSGGIDPLTTLPDGGLITQDNVDKFTPEWNG
ncbi:sugar ABC transporter substrate-binding protein [Ascidiaceihabitans sp.]|uniref:sugar ABC transporter substrate-binding protein n=1 Tax=Ascidiaceihabitans sp. TaxID=1872644 RepID=UPI003296D332